MDLQTENTHFENVTHPQLDQAFDDDTARGSFIILSSDAGFIQAAGDSDTPYHLEYNENDELFHATKPLTKQQVHETFRKYLNQDPTWKTDHTWESLGDPANPNDPTPAKPWWKFW